MYTKATSHPIYLPQKRYLAENWLWISFKSLQSYRWRNPVIVSLISYVPHSLRISESLDIQLRWYHSCNWHHEPLKGLFHKMCLNFSMWSNSQKKKELNLTCDYTPCQKKDLELHIVFKNGNIIQKERTGMWMTAYQFRIQCKVRTFQLLQTGQIIMC